MKELPLTDLTLKPNQRKRLFALTGPINVFKKKLAASLNPRQTQERVSANEDAARQRLARIWGTKKWSVKSQNAIAGALGLTAHDLVAHVVSGTPLAPPLSPPEPAPLFTRELIGLLDSLRMLGVSDNVRFRPEALDYTKVESYCVPVKVMFEDELHRHLGVRGQRVSGERTSTHEDLLRRDNGTNVQRFALNRFLDTAHRRLLLRGEPGEGKTVALWLYVADVCRALIARLQLEPGAYKCEDFILPLILPLREFHRRNSVSLVSGTSPPRLLESAKDFLLDYAHDGDESTLKALSSFIKSKTKRGEYSLLLDAFDEMPPESLGALRHQLAQVNAQRVVVTSRLNVDHELLANPVRLRMVCFWPRDVQEFLRRFFSHQPRHLKTIARIQQMLRVSAGVRSLAQIPLLLAMLCYQQESGGSRAPLPRNRTDLVRNSIVSMMRRRDEKCGIEERPLRYQAKLEVLAMLAWRFLERNPTTLLSSELASTLTLAIISQTELQHDTPETILKELVEDGILIPFGSDYSFILRFFHEFGAAWYLGRTLVTQYHECSRYVPLLRSVAEEWPHEPPWRGFKPLNQQGWWYIWPLAAGCANPPWVVEAITEEAEAREDVLSSRTVLLAHAVAEFAAREAHDFSSSASKERLPSVLLSNLTERMVNLLADPTLGTEHIGPYKIAFAQLPTQDAAHKLATRLHEAHRSEEERSNYAYALGELGNSFAEKTLVDYVEAPTGTDFKLQSVCAVALGQIGSDWAKAVILKALKARSHHHYYLQIGCLSALERFADYDYAEVVNQIIRTPEQHVDLRAHAIGLGAQLPFDCCGDTILNVLDDPGDPDTRTNDHLRECCVVALGELGDDMARTKLTTLLESEKGDNSLIPIVIRALGRIGDPMAVAALEQIANGKRPRDHLIGSALELARLGHHSYLGKLREVIRQRVRTLHCEAIVRFLAEVGEEEDVELLESVITDGDSEPLRKLAAASLAGIRLPNAVEKLERLASMPSLPESLRWRCLLDSVNGGSKRGEDQLLKVLASRPMEVPHLRAAIAALGGNESEQARAWIACMLSHESEFVRSAARSALRNLQKKSGARLLVTGEWEES
jgi:HEAT repeat protein